jgi:hypothetical protein
MSEDGVSEGAITKAELAELADLFDKAESRFEDRIREIFEQKVVPAYPQLGFSIFCCKVRSLCREYLKRNAP